MELVDVCDLCGLSMCLFLLCRDVLLIFVGRVHVSFLKESSQMHLVYLE